MSLIHVQEEEEEEKIWKSYFHVQWTFKFDIKWPSSFCIGIYVQFTYINRLWLKRPLLIYGSFRVKDFSRLRNHNKHLREEKDALSFVFEKRSIQLLNLLKKTKFSNFNRFRIHWIGEIEKSTKHTLGLHIDAHTCS